MAAAASIQKQPEASGCSTKEAKNETLMEPMTSTVTFPRRSRGRQSAAAEDAYWTDVAHLRRWMQSYVVRLGFAPSSRGWCYALESAGAITKGEFDLAIRTLASLRKSGDLDLDE